MQQNLPPAPWQRSLSELDERLTEPVELHCIGGFVVSLLYGMPRPTADVDFLPVVPHTEMRHLLDLAGHGSPLHKRFGLYLQHVGVASLPEAYEARLIPMFPGAYRNLRLWGAEAYDHEHASKGPPSRGCLHRRPALYLAFRLFRGREARRICRPRPQPVLWTGLV